MGNLITNEKAGSDKEHYLKLSNGATSVLISVLALSGSDLAETLWEKELIIWLSEKDQFIYGPGVVGFDLDEIAWKRENFAEQKNFFLKTIDTALTRHRWNLLGYDPPFLSQNLQQLRSMVEQYKIDFIEENKTWNWWARTEDFVKCPVHNVFLHAYSCVICNDR